MTAATPTRSALELRKKIADHLGVSPRDLPKQISERSSVTYQTAKNFCDNADYSGKVFKEIYHLIKSSPDELKRELALDYAVKMFPTELRCELTRLITS